MVRIDTPTLNSLLVAARMGMERRQYAPSHKRSRLYNIQQGASSTTDEIAAIQRRLCTDHVLDRNRGDLTRDLAATQRSVHILQSEIEDLKVFKAILEGHLLVHPGDTGPSWNTSLTPRSRDSTPRPGCLGFGDGHSRTFHGMLRARSNVRERLFLDEGDVRRGGAGPQAAHASRWTAVDVHLPPYANMTTWPLRKG